MRRKRPNRGVEMSDHLFSGTHWSQGNRLLVYRPTDRRVHILIPRRPERAQVVGPRQSVCGAATINLGCLTPCIKLKAEQDYEAPVASCGVLSKERLARRGYLDVVLAKLFRKRLDQVGSGICWQPPSCRASQCARKKASGAHVA